MIRGGPDCKFNKRKRRSYCKWDAINWNFSRNFLFNFTFCKGKCTLLILTGCGTQSLILTTCRTKKTTGFWIQNRKNTLLGTAAPR